MSATSSGVDVRTATGDDLAQIVHIYNHYVVHTPITFDLAPFAVGERRGWFEQFSTTGRHRLLVAVDRGTVVGYTGSHQFRPKAAYDTTVETTVYCAPSALGRGIGRQLYLALFQAIETEDIHSLLAAITLPNDASVSLHERFGFTLSGVTRAVGRKFDRYWDVGWYERILE
ncbi:MAG: N-acetyltransferase family protein [Acidimicrobiales bacterium]